jgi:hypothetical protein
VGVWVWAWVVGWVGGWGMCISIYMHKVVVYEVLSIMAQH